MLRPASWESTPLHRGVALFIEENELQQLESPWEDIREPWPDERKLLTELLVEAVDLGKRSQARNLLLHGADPDPALEAAIRRDDLEVLAMLLDHGAIPTTRAASQAARQLLDESREKVRDTRCQVDCADFDHDGLVLAAISLQGRHPTSREILQERGHGRRWVLQTYALGPNPKGGEPVVALIPLEHNLAPQPGTTLHSIGHMTEAEFRAVLGNYYADQAKRVASSDQTTQNEKVERE